MTTVVEANLRKMAESFSFDLFGVADPLCSELQRAPEGHRPQDYLPNVKSVIVLGVRVIDSILQTTPSGIYSKHYDALNELLNSGAYKLVKWLEDKDYRSMYFPETDSYQILWEQYNAGYDSFVPCFNHMAAAVAAGLGTPVPCGSCAKAETCDRALFHVAPDNSSLLVCEQKVEAAKEILPAAPEIPQDILALAREKAGTRAEVLDLKDIGAGYYQDVKQGYALLDGFDRALEHIIDPEECLERCTHGFHFAFDSRQAEPRTRYVCSDPKCLAKKKSAFTRAKNAEGQARKNAERKAIKEAIAQTTTLDRARIKLILLAQMDGRHTERAYYSASDGKQPETWLWERLSAGTPTIERKREDLFKRIDKLSDEELAKLVVEFMFYYLTGNPDSHEEA